MSSVIVQLRLGRSFAQLHERSTAAMVSSIPERQPFSNLLAKRRQFFATCTAFRISHHELLPHLTIDYYAGNLLFTHYHGCVQERLAGLAEELAVALAQFDLPFLGAVKKFRPDNLSHSEAEKFKPELLCGTLPPERFAVREYDLQFYISFNSGYGTGLFLDIKRARQRVRQSTKPGDEVLNLFSYTGGFSIAAAKAGAGRVLEVDSSAHWLRWARENQTLNEAATIRQRKEEAVAFLHKQKNESFDLIICDPPTYSSQKSGARFTVAKGFETMLPDLQRVLRPRGVLLACTNYRELARGKFFKLFSPKFVLEEEIPISEDFNRDDYLKAGLFRKA